MGSVSKRALVLTVCCAMLVTGSARAANAAEASVDIRKVDSSSFPEVTVTVAVKADDRLTEDDLQLAVGGSAVEDVELHSLAESGQQVDVVLVIDTSGSMEGDALASAVAAALRFVTTLPDEIRLGILTFSDRARVLQPVSDDHAQALEALGTLEARGETALYDALGAAARMFSGTAQRNIVLLSDGGDTASHSGLKSATAAARSAGATVYAVGLNTPDTDVAALRSIAQATAGRYSPAATARLTTIYQDLATELSNQYLVSYLSSRKWHGQVTLSVSAFGVADTALVLFPKIEAPPPPSQPSTKPEGKPLLAKGWGLAVALALCFAAVFAIMFMLLGAGVRTRRDRELAKRMAAGASVPVPHDVRQIHERNIASWIPHVFVRAAERAADAGGFGTELDSKLERAGLPLRAGEFIAGTAVVAVVGAMLGTLLFGALVPGLLLAGIAAAIPSILLSIAVRRRIARLHGQLADVLMILASSLRAGHSFFQALDMVAKEIGDPAAEEFNRVVAEIRLGRPLDEAMNGLADRIGSDDFKWAVLAVNIQREVGGNLAEVLDTVADTVRERDTIRRQIDVLTAEGKLSVAVLTALPIGVGLYIWKVNPSYMNLLFTTRIGLGMTAVATGLLMIGIMWMRKVVKIDV